MFGDQTLQTNKTSPREQKKCFKFLIECLMASKVYQTRPNTNKQHQTRWPNGKMFGYQTMLDGVWSPKVFRLSRALNAERAYKRSAALEVQPKTRHLL